MTRNIDNRVEVACPIYDKELQQQMIDTFEISWNDNVKARLVNLPIQNKMVECKSGESHRRSQWDTYEYLKNKLNFEDS